MKNVLVTGAYGGMGRAAVKSLRDRGYFVFALDKSIGKREDNVIPVKADITCEDSLRSAFEEVKKHTDSLYAVIHFAGIYMLDSLCEMDEVSFDRIFDINVKGAFLVNKTFLPLMKKGSRILMTTSELAPLDPLPFTGIYGVTKAALDKYAYSLAMELQLLGISVSVLRAGAVKTDMLGASTDALDHFCNETKLYSCNAKRFKGIVESVEARNVESTVIGKRCVSIVEKRSPKFAYCINRNPLLLMLNLLPKRLQLWIIKKVLS